MRRIVDLTGTNFSRIDFSEATIVDFYCQEKLPSIFEFSIYGATLLLEPRWKHTEPIGASRTKDEDMFVAGNGIIRIAGLTGGSMYIGIYENNCDKYGSSKWAKNCNGSIVTCRREWVSDEMQHADAYLWECGIAWPRGSCCLYLFVKDGSVAYEYEDTDMITAERYCSPEGEKYYFMRYT